MFLEAMHLIDGGVVVSFVKKMFDVGQKKTKYSLPASVVSRCNKLIDAWASCTPYEFQRRLRNTSHVGRWKMVEGRMFLLYYAPVLYSVLQKQANEQFSTLMYLTKSIRLLSGDSVDPVPKVKMSNLIVVHQWSSYSVKFLKYINGFCFVLGAGRY